METESKKTKLDYSIVDDAERVEIVNKIIEENKDKTLNNKYLETLADYLVYNMSKEERKERNILTDNRMVTVNKRETSYQGLVSKFENGEDGLYNLITNDKNILLTPKTSITKEDIEEIKPLQDLRAAMEIVEQEEKKAVGKKRFLLKKQLIQMRQDQYSIKNDFKQPMYSMNTIKNYLKSEFSENISMDSNQEPVSDGILSLFDPKHVSAILCNYSLLKEQCWGKFSNDLYFLMEDFDKLLSKTLNENLIYKKIVEYKIKGKQNLDIQKLLEKEFDKTYSIEYLSCLWRNKIPKLLAEQAKEDYIIWYYSNQEYGKWKKCSRCGQIKLAHNRFFSKNSTSKDGYYSICKECRNAKNKKKGE